MLVMLRVRTSNSALVLFLFFDKVPCLLFTQPHVVLSSMVEGNIKAVKDRRKLAQVLASMKIGLGKALAPPTGSSVASAEISPSTPIVAEEPVEVVFCLN